MQLILSLFVCVGVGGELLQKFVWLNILVFHFFITLTLKKGCDSWHDLDTILQVLVAPRYELQDKPIEVPSGLLNSSSVVNWNTVLLSKDRKGRLGNWNLRLQNGSLLKKSLWRYIEEGNALEKEVIKAEYGVLTPWCTESTVEPYGVWEYGEQSQVCGHKWRQTFISKWEMTVKQDSGRMSG